MVNSYDENGDKLFQFNEFTNLMNSIEPNIDQQFILRIFKKTILQQNNTKLDGITIDNLTDLILKYSVGGYGKPVFSDYLESKRAQYKEIKKKR